MRSMLNRRQWLLLLAAGTMASLTGCTDAKPGAGNPRTASGSPGGASPFAVAPPPLLPPPPRGPRIPIAPETLSGLPGDGTSMALTVDDGTNPDVVAAYVQFARDTGARFTFFVTACYDSWTINRDALRPLVESGQIQLGNHTWDHPALTRLSATGIADQLNRTKQFLQDAFGVDGTPYFRPPYGYHNAAVDRIAADCGYTVPTMWYGSLSDAGLVTEDYIVQMADQWFNDQSIVIGHANHLPVTHVYGQLVDIIRSRNLSMVTLNDVLLPPGGTA
ncbi:polysaccharide deacetylase family protein [Nocardia sp. alder85J]|uniref:polysaccharide deacetylase family protein n=1 Tax=Nocardia sp. alder85J TaxID=2862949 RepID=UPI001CD7ACD8|nr:polysaccharide deacetylase family protein [Nocardia sp. alder85J]MCX4096352.1 polysaccharide deacetylase family protein [Nocardia sp. alder85J]